MGAEFTPKKSGVSLLSATLLSATCMVGSGWLFSAQLTAKIAGNWAFLAWVLAAILVLLVGLCLAKVVAVYPVRGATTRSSALSHNGIFGMPFAFANWFGIMVVIATEAQATTQYLSAAIGSDALMQNHVLTYGGKFLALGILLVYLIVNFYGIKLLTRVNNVVTVLKVFTPLFAIAVFLIAAFDHSGLSNNFNLPTNGDYGFSSAVMAIIGAGLIYSFNGFQISVSFASEIKNPKRNVPLSIILSIFIILIVYMGLQYAFMAAVPHELLVKNGGWQGMNFSSPLLNLAMLLGLNFLAILLLADSVVSPSGTGYTYLGASSRMLYAMSAEGQMPRWIAKLDPVYNFSKRSMMINWILAAIVLFNAESWAALMVVVTGYHVVGYMAAPISMGAIAPKTRWLGLVVFVILGLIMLTIPSHDLMLVNSSLTILLLIYAFIQHKVGVQKLLLFILPFIAYLWLLYIVPNIWFVAVISVIFYILITTKSYVAMCKEHGDLNRVIED
ncbi:MULTISPECIES: APC family permease [Cysteiniphilum]|uniref:APC family permease n=1 Tax=Cysteiniphilum TaxID=2056696 RepID=UPI00178672DE|nr:MULTISPECIES: APC family permease [Cysteiniphilum]